MKKIAAAFTVWRLGLFLAAWLSTYIIVKFGERFPYADVVLTTTGLPNWVWSFGNFDGVHYLRLSLWGYEFSQYSQAFFPLYPALMKFTSLGVLNFFQVNEKLIYFGAGLVLSNLFFLAALWVLYKLFRVDFSKEVALRSLILLLVFPTSFYFGAIYSESLFLLLSVTSLLFIRRKNYLLGGFFAGAASAARILGLLLFLVLLLEMFFDYRKNRQSIKVEELFKGIFGFFIAPIGIIFYMFYLDLNFNNPLYFLTAQPLFGAERSAQPFILLPQVIFRYLKMFATVPVNSLTFFNIFSELVFTLIPISLVLLFWRKMRLSYIIFTLGCLILPTLTGTLSSMPRYSLMSFLLLPFIVQKTGRYYRYLVIVFAILMLILLSMFTRGYWVA